MLEKSALHSELPHRRQRDAGGSVLCVRFSLCWGVGVWGCLLSKNKKIRLLWIEQPFLGRSKRADAEGEWGWLVIHFY
jgi:hypothetical protein